MKASEEIRKKLRILIIVIIISIVVFKNWDGLKSILANLF
jgi:hypothetical protein